MIVDFSLTERKTIFLDNNMELDYWKINIILMDI